MRLIRIVDVIANSDETNPDTEPCLAVDPSNPRQMVVTSFTPAATGPNGSVFVSEDGGEHWKENDEVSGGASLDQTISFAGISGRLYIATLLTNFNLVIESTTNPSAGTPFSVLKSYPDTRPTLKDQPWIVATTVPDGPDKGQDRLYVGYNDNSLSLGATVNVCFDATNANPVFSPVLLDTRTTHTPQDGAPVRCAIHRDGTVYAGFQGLKSLDGSGNAVVDFVMTRDDNWGRNNFTDLMDKSDNKSGRIVTTGNVAEFADIGKERPTFTGSDTNVDPNNSDIVYMCWHDDVGPTKTQTLHVRRSLNRGVDWSGDLIAVSNVVLAEMAINNAGTVGLVYQQLVNNLWETHFRTTKDGSNWDDIVLARTALPTNTGDPALGDFLRLLAVGPHFYGVFPSMNTPGAANFLPNGGGTVSFQRNINSAGNGLVGSDGHSSVNASVDPFFFKVEEKSVIFQLERNPISQDEVDARRAAGQLPIKDAFRVIVDGFTADELSIQGPNGQLPVPSPTQGMTISCTRNVADTLSYGKEIQRFTFFYDINFDATDDPFHFPSNSQDYPLKATAGTSPMTVSNSAFLTLIKLPDPFILHGDTPWLSVDIRVFVARPGLPPVPGNAATVSDAAHCPQFIQGLIKNITVDQFDNGLKSSEDASKLYTQSTDGEQAVFNFAIAKVHYIGNNPHPFDVRVFFRLFQAQTTSGQFDYTTGMSLAQPAQYRRTINPSGDPIALAGFQSGEYVTIPFFAEDRKDSTAVPMTSQSDKPNVQTFADPGRQSSSEIKFYGCWLDINQPTRIDKTTGQIVPNNVLPIFVPAVNDGGPDGPFHGAPVPIQSVIRGLHHCIIAEIDYTPTPIPPGKDPGNWDKLAQRNITWSDVGSATAVALFDIKPPVLLPSLPPDQTPDELMIDWGKTRTHSRAQIYLPEMKASAILALASRMYSPSDNLSFIDDNTIGCRVGGLTYIPIPPGTRAAADANYVGLISIEMSASLREGEIFNVIVRQVTNDAAPKPDIPRLAIEAAAQRQQILSAADPNLLVWRRSSGTFQLTVPVRNKATLLPRELNDYAFLLAIGQIIPSKSRWFKVFQRYLQVVAGRVTSFGGDPTTVPPSLTGILDDSPDHECDCCPRCCACRSKTGHRDPGRCPCCHCGRRHHSCCPDKTHRHHSCPECAKPSCPKRGRPPCPKLEEQCDPLHWVPAQETCHHGCSSGENGVNVKDIGEEEM
jgi:hypothetical protein